MIQAVNNFDQYAMSQNITTENINSIMFYNQGNVTAVINGTLKVKPGSSFSLSQVQPDIVDTTVYSLRFNLADADTTGTNQDLVVITTSITQMKMTNGFTHCAQL